MAVANFKCPACNGKVYDNRADKKNPKSPCYKCSNKACTGTDNGPWALWDPDGTKAPRSTAPASQASNGTAPSQPGPLPSNRLTGDQYVEATCAIAMQLCVGLRGVVKELQLEVSDAAIFAEALSTARGAWVGHDHGTVRLGPEPEPAPVPVKPVTEWLAKVAGCGTAKHIQAVLMGMVGDDRLDGVERNEIADAIKQRTAEIELLG